MVEIGGRPILWHIMKLYSHHGIRDFIICCGYKGHMIKEYFATYFLRESDLRFDWRNDRMDVLDNRSEPWTVTLIDTGLKTATGGRLKKVREYIGDETFCFTYGDGVCNVDIQEVIQFHRKKNVLATLTAVQPPGRYGAFELVDDNTGMQWLKDRARGDGSWVNGGFFVVEPAAIDYVEDDLIMWEAAPMERLAEEGQVAAYKHGGFWRCMDHLSDKVYLEDLWSGGEPPWKVWQ
jgi:glucose-1-phosphate cytidylyltransferase